MAEPLQPEAAVRLLLVRHGESEGNRLRQFSRDNDIDLTERGVEQARAPGRWISDRFSPTRVVASPYYRTLRTARLLAESMGHDGSIDTEHGLREREIGALAGAPYSAMRDDPTFDQGRFWEAFFACCRSREEPAATMELAYRVQTPLQIAVLGWRQGKVATFDAEREQIVL